MRFRYIILIALVILGLLWLALVQTGHPVLAGVILGLPIGFAIAVAWMVYEVSCDPRKLVDPSW